METETRREGQHKDTIVMMTGAELDYKAGKERELDIGTETRREGQNEDAIEVMAGAELD